MRKKVLKYILFSTILIVTVAGILGCSSEVENEVEKPIGELEYFNYYYYTLDPMFMHEYTLEYTGEKVIFIYKDGFDDMILEQKQFEVDKTILSDLENIILDNEIYIWDKWNKNPDVYDADGFGLELRYNDSEIKAQAYHEKPHNFYEINQIFEDYFQNIVETIEY